jgi:hypothetical protein
MDTILLAWLVERHVELSDVVRAMSRPSGRPQIRSPPRTTRCVSRCTRWSFGLAEYTYV